MCIGALRGASGSAALRRAAPPHRPLASVRLGAASHTSYTLCEMPASRSKLQIFGVRDLYSPSSSSISLLRDPHHRKACVYLHAQGGCHMVAYACLQLEVDRLYRVSSGHDKVARLHSEGFSSRCLLVRTRTYGCNAASHRKASISSHACDRTRKWGVSAGRRHRGRPTTALRSLRPQEHCLHPLHSSNLPPSTIARVLGVRESTRSWHFA